MFSAVRVLVLCLSCFMYASAITPDDALALDAVFEDFTNRFGDKDDQNAFGAAKGTIENGEGKAYMGGGYWYGTADAGSSVQSEAGDEIKSKIGKAIDATDPEARCLHVLLTTSTSGNDISWAAVGSNLTNEDEYINASKVTGISVTAKGSGTIRVNLITKDYLEAGVEWKDWGYYGFDLNLTASKKTTEFANADIEPVEYSYGYEEELTWAHDGSKALNKIEFQVKDGDDADLYLYELKFTGVTYADFGFVKVPVVTGNIKNTSRNALAVKGSQIAYTIAQPQNLSIQLMNMAGCRVATLFNGNAVAGSHTVNLQQLSGVAGGRYFIRMNGSDVSIMEPFTIVK